MEEKELKMQISSQQQWVEKAVEDIASFTASGLNVNLFGVRMVSRELLINAVEHGNHNDSQKLIFISVNLLEDDRLHLCVKDQGEGFDFESIDWQMKEDTSSPRRRGLSLCNHYCDDIQFFHQGSEVQVWYSNTNSGNFNCEMTGERCVIVPEGPISAANYEEFKELLTRTMEEGCLEFHFDFSHVSEMDSLALSVLLSFGSKIGKDEKFSEPVILKASDDLKMLLNFTHADRHFRIK
jgi:anti-sigma regulatory factor (Ser/Thr protein kinase)/anti-anti-sigma regulatory factor